MAKKLRSVWAVEQVRDDGRSYAKRRWVGDKIATTHPLRIFRETQARARAAVTQDTRFLQQYRPVEFREVEMPDGKQNER